MQLSVNRWINMKIMAGRHLHNWRDKCQCWVAMSTTSKPPSSTRLLGSGPDAGTHELLTYFHYMKYLMDFLIFLQCFFQYRSGKGNAKRLIAIADLVLLYSKCMEGKYCKVDVLSFDLYKSCQLQSATKCAIHTVLQSVRAPASLEWRAGVKTHLNHWLWMYNSSSITRRSTSTSIVSCRR